MLTIEQALTAREFHYGQCTRIDGPRGGVRVHQEVWRRNGATKTWRTRPGEYRIPVKRGLRTYGYVTTNNSTNMHAAEDCPLHKTGEASWS